MNSREAEKQYNLRKWAQIIKECKSSGEKVMDWIESHNISKDQYYYWQRRLKDAYMDSNLQQSPAFVELTVAEEDNTTALTVKGRYLITHGGRVDTTLAYDRRNLISQISGLCNNYNQMTRTANGCGYVFDITMRTGNHLLEQIKDLLQEVVNRWQ